MVQRVELRLLLRREDGFALLLERGEGRLDLLADRPDLLLLRADGARVGFSDQHLLELTAQRVLLLEQRMARLVEALLRALPRRGLIGGEIERGGEIDA